MRRASGIFPSGVRHRVVAATMLMAGITYLDRVCISILAPSIMRDLSLSMDQMSYVFSAFTFAYAIFEIPTAWWADRVGSRRVLARIVAWWSAFTMLTAAAWSYSSMLALRALFGVGEAGAWPNAGRVFSKWIPSHERARVQGVFFAGAHLAGGFTPAVVAWIAGYLSWRPVFVLVGTTGFVWAAFWHWWFRDEPREHASVTTQELDLIETTRSADTGHSHGNWVECFRTPSLFPLCVQYFANTYGFFFFITWLPSYLTNAHGMKSTELAIFAGLPLLMSAAADILGGVATDALNTRLGVTRGTRTAGVVAYTIACATLFAGASAVDGRTAGFLIAIAGAWSMFALPAAWSTAIRLGGENAAMMGAIMNTSGQIGGILSPIVVSRVVGATGDWNMPLRVLATLYAAAALSWLVIHPTRRVVSAS